MLTVGLDVHFRKSAMCVLDENGKKLREVEVKGHWPAVIAELGRLDEPFQICYEASLGYGHLYEQIGQLPRAHKTVVAHPGQLRLIYRARRKNDRVDAEKLAKLLYLEQVPAVHVPSLNVREWRGLIEWRQKLLQRRVMVKNQIRTLLKTSGLVPLKGDKLWTKAGLAWLAEQTFPSRLSAIRRDMLREELGQHHKRMAQVEAELAQIAQQHPGVQLLLTIPGVGMRTAEAFMAYVDQPERFGSSRQAGVYFGLVPCQDASSDRNRLGHITREGPPTVRKLLTEAAWQGVRRDPTIKAHFAQINKGNPERKKIALVATTRWLATVMLAMLKSGQAWRGTAPAPQNSSAPAGAAARAG